MEKYSITKDELHQQVEKNKKYKQRIIRVPVATNIRMVNGKLNYDVEEYLEIPADMIPGNQFFN